MSHFGLCPV
jgi:long-chain acyl-CoA synthetase